jgi:hypothetical protein
MVGQHPCSILVALERAQALLERALPIWLHTMRLRG